ncbi:MAG TPA: hypothetical protein VGC21_01375 [Telluria sp.]
MAAVRQLAQQLRGQLLVAVHHGDTRAAAFRNNAFSALALRSVRQYEDPALQQFKLFSINQP